MVKDAAGNIQYQTEFGAQYAKLGALEKLGTGTFWAQTGASAGAQGLASVATGGKFGQGALGGIGSAVGGNFNTAVGDWAQQNGIAGGDWSKMLLHAGIGGAQAALTGKDALAGAIGGAAAEALSPLANELDKATGNKAAGELLTVAGSLAANQLLNRNASAGDLTAAYQALQTDRLNRQLHVARQQAFGASGKSRLIDKGAQPLKESIAEIGDQYREATGCQRGAPCEKAFWSEVRDMQAPFILAKDESATEQTKNLIAYLGSPFADAYKSDAVLRGEVDRRIAQAPDSRVVDVGDLLGYANQLGYQRALDTAGAAHAASTAPEAERSRQIELTALRLMRQDESGEFGTQNTQQTLERAKTEETAAMLLGAWAVVKPVASRGAGTALQRESGGEKTSPSPTLTREGANNVGELKAPVSNPAGADRAARYGENWQGVSANETIAQVAGKNPVVTYTESGKTIYTNSTTGMQVVYDNAGRYFRIENTNATGPLRFTDQFGKPIPNNVPLIQPSKTTLVGVPSDVRNALTHFKDID